MWRILVSLRLRLEGHRGRLGVSEVGEEMVEVEVEDVQQQQQDAHRHQHQGNPHQYGHRVKLKKKRPLYDC